jgi:hypothetical protein
MAISAETTKRNTRLTQFEDVKDIVIANMVKNVPELKKAKETKANQSLMAFQ